MFANNHKTVIVLDHSPYFGKDSKHTVELDVFTKSRNPGIIPLAPISKSLWTCNVEAVLEYVRVVCDLFPHSKCIRVVASDVQATSLNTWEQEQQSLNKLIMALGELGPPKEKGPKEESNVIHGLNYAIEVLCEPTPLQHTSRISLSEDGEELLNTGRIVCLTNCKTDNHMKMLEECVSEALSQHNKLAMSTDRLLPVHHCELVLVNCTPLCLSSNIKPRNRRELTSILASEIHVSQSGSHISKKLLELAYKQFSLCSTTVIGIPMKEEQNASSSANYDVELFHEDIAHLELFKSGSHEGLVIPSKEGLYTDTVTLKWCTPKSNTVELHQCTSAHRITPVDVISRPSSCLTNFLLSGRSVMLEQPRKTGARVVSHMLTSHGGEIFIHVLAMSRSILEDPPSITEGCGGRITDYRVPDFGEFMKENKLAPATDVSSTDEPPIQKAKRHLERISRVWPMVTGETIIFNMLSHLDPLPSLIVKEKLDEEEVLECKKAIFHVVGMESRNEVLSIPTSGSSRKGVKRDEQYRQMWSEFEKFVRAHSTTSPMHEKVLQCLLECKKPSGEDIKPAVEKPVIKEESVDQIWQQFDKYQSLTERERSDLDQKPDIKRSESPPLKKMRLTSFPSVEKSVAGSQSLLSLWTNRVASVHSSRHAEFAGRLESTGSQAELYIHMKDEMDSLPDLSNNGKGPQNNGKGLINGKKKQS